MIFNFIVDGDYENISTTKFSRFTVTGPQSRNLELLGPLKEDYYLALNDWVCNKCYKEVGFPKSGNSKSRFLQTRNEVLENTIKNY